MFDDIEHALQGVMGKGPFEWVAGGIRAGLRPLHPARAAQADGEGRDRDDRPPHREGQGGPRVQGDLNERALAVKIFHTTNVFKGLTKYIDGTPGSRASHGDTGSW